MKVIERIMGASGEQWFGFTLLVFFAAILSVIVTMMASDHKVRCYYMQTEMTNAGIAYKIMADIDWSGDMKSFTSGDADKVLEVISGMNQCAVK